MGVYTCMKTKSFYLFSYVNKCDSFSVAYIKSVDGFVGCYRGLGPKLCASAVSGITYQKVYEGIKFEDDKTTKTDEDATEEER